MKGSALARVAAVLALVACGPRASGGGQETQAPGSVPSALSKRVGQVLELSVPLVGGGQQGLAELRGKAVLLELADASEPDRDAVQRRWRALAEQRGAAVAVVCVAMDAEASALPASWTEDPPPFVMGWDPQGAVAARLQVRVLPTVVLLDASGKIVGVYEGELPDEPEYRAVRAKVSFEQLCRRPDLCAEVTRQPIDRFGFDAAILFSDILTVFDAMGVEVRFEPAPVVAEPVRTVADVERLCFGRADDRLGYVYDAVAACKKELGDRVPLIGFCGAPFTTASYMVEGGGSKEFLHVKRMAFTEPVVFGGLLERITTVLVEYLAGQVRAGADALQIFESWGSAMAPEDYRVHVLPHLGRLVSEAKGLGVPVILFVRGNASLLGQVKDLGADVLGIDWGIEMERAIAVVGEDKVVQGNLDPIVLFAPADELERRARAIVEAGRRARAHVFNLGHGISQHTDPEAVARLVEAVHSA